MSASDHGAVQHAVFAALSGATALLARLPGGAAGITAFARAGQSLPYVVIKSIASQPVTGAGDTLDAVDVSCAAYSEQPGGWEARAVLQDIALALAAPLDVAGSRTVVQREASAQTELMADGRIYRATYVMRLLLEKEDI